MRDMGYGKGYKYAHDYEQHAVEQEYRPPQLQGNAYYQPHRPRLRGPHPGMAGPPPPDCGCMILPLPNRATPAARADV